MKNYILKAYLVKRWHDGEMKVVLRADASPNIGTGHVMRQIALAEVLLLQDVEVFLVGEVSGPSWLEHKLTKLQGLQRVNQPTGSFDAGVLGKLGASASTIDSYAIRQNELAEWESKSSKTLVFIDGPWQRLEGGVGVVPGISDQFTWLGDLRRRFDNVYVGPEYLMIREEIKRAKQQRLQEPPSSPQILVVFGGADPLGRAQLVESALEKVFSECRVVVMGANEGGHLGEISSSSYRGVFYPPRSNFVQELVKSSLVISAVGTTTAELIFLGIPSIFIPVAGNQAENAKALERLSPSIVLWPDTPDFEARLLSAVSTAIKSGKFHPLPIVNLPSLDGGGAMRVASLLLN